MDPSLYQTTQDPNGKSDSHGEMSILVVDDDPAICQLVRYILRKAFPKAKISVTADGFAALDMLEFLQPDVILLDLNMPRMDGFTFCRRLQDGKWSRRPAVVAITADASRQNTSRILECGARRCLAKPLNLDVLIREVADAVGETALKNATGNYTGDKET